MINGNHNQFRDGLVALYQHLIEATSTLDEHSINDICERNLAVQFSQFFEDLREVEDDWTIKALTTEEEPRFTCIDFNNQMYASINREENRHNGVVVMPGSSGGWTNDKAFIPTNVNENPPLFLTVEVVLKVETNLKLKLLPINEADDDLE